MTDLDLQKNLVTRVNVGDMLTRTAWRSPEHEAVVDGPRRLTYRELNAAVNQLANALLTAGYRRGDALEKRRSMMEAWASWCEPKQRNVVAFARAAANGN